MYRGGYVYILTNKSRTTLYIGVTSRLSIRLWEHKNNFHGDNSFTAKYNLHHLVYYEGFDNIVEAIAREKQLKKWSRAKKDALISKLNANWDDLSNTVVDF